MKTGFDALTESLTLYFDWVDSNRIFAIEKAEREAPCLSLWRDGHVTICFRPEDAASILKSFKDLIQKTS